MVGLAIIAVSLAPFRSGLYIIRYFGIIRYYSALDQVKKYGWFLLLLVGWLVFSCFLFFRIPCLLFLSVWLVLVVVGCGSGWLVDSVVFGRLFLCQLNCLIELFSEFV